MLPGHFEFSSLSIIQNIQLQKTGSQAANEFSWKETRGIIYYRNTNSSFCDSKYKIKERAMIWLTFTKITVTFQIKLDIFMVMLNKWYEVGDNVFK